MSSAAAPQADAALAAAVADARAVLAPLYAALADEQLRRRRRWEDERALLRCVVCSVW